MTLEARKFRLIQLISSLEDELLIGKLEGLLNELNQMETADKTLLALSKPIREKIDIDQLIKEQNYIHPTRAELDKIIDEANIEESIEDLLELI